MSERKKNAIVSTRCVLLLAFARAEVSWAYEMIGLARELTGGYGSYPRSMVHKGIIDLYNEGLLEVCSPKNMEQERGPERVYYRLTKAGKKQAEEYTAVLRTLAKAAGKL